MPKKAFSDLKIAFSTVYICSERAFRRRLGSVSQNRCHKVEPKDAGRGSNSRYRKLQQSSRSKNRDLSLEKE